MKITVLNESKPVKISGGITQEEFKESDGISCEFDNKDADPINWTNATIQYDYAYNIDGKKFIRLVMWNITKGKPRYYKILDVKDKSTAKGDYEAMKKAYASTLRKSKGSFPKLESSLKGIATGLGMVDDEVHALAVFNKNNGTDFTYAGHKVLPNGELGARA